MSFRLANRPYLKAHSNRVRSTRPRQSGRVACAAVPAPPVDNPALEVTMYSTIHSIGKYGDGIATAEAR